MQLGRTRVRARSTALCLAFALVTPNASAHEGLHEQIAALTRELAAHPDDPSLLRRRGELHRLHRAWHEALADLNRAARLAPALDGLALSRGHLYVDMGLPASARAVLDASLARHPDDDACLALRADVRAALGDAEGAIRDYTAAIAFADPPLPDYFIERARVQASLGGEHVAGAVRGLDEGIARLGTVPSLEMLGVDLERSRGAFDAALERIGRIAAASPRKERWLAWRGDVLLQAGRNADAAAAYRAARDAIARLKPKLRRAPAVRELESHVARRLAAFDDPMEAIR